MRVTRGAGFGISLVALVLAAMHTEGEWSSIPANFRQALFIGVLAYGVLLAGRMIHHALVVATAPVGNGSLRGAGPVA
jgi:Na+-translocating ferredoxin:NAD+ oxidoreductase RnfA subunit